MKRFISIVLALAIAATMLFAFAADVHGENVSEIAENNPCITADTGEKINLSSYSVVFNGDTSATADVKWTLGGKTVTEYTPAAKGVTKLVASSGSKQKNIYVVAKEASEKEYVLFEADFSDATIDSLKADGWRFTGNGGSFDVKDGALNIGGLGDGYARAMLPAWLAEFGDYSVTTEIKMLSTSDTGRWFGVVYRIQDIAGNAYPYYHMCIRENTTSSNGIEFAERTASNNWNVASTAAFTIRSMKDGFHTVNVQAKGTDVLYAIDGEEALYTTDAVIGQKTKTYLKGGLGLTMNYGTTAVKSYKVCVQTESPVHIPKKTTLINNLHESLNLINTIANVGYIKDSSVKGGSALYDVSAVSDIKKLLTDCAEAKCLPTFRVANRTEADKLLAAVTAAGAKDANVISADADVLGYIRGKNTLIRTGLELTIGKETLTSKEADEIRVKVRKAPATFCVIKVADAKKQVVAELQELAVAVWVNVEGKAEGDEFVKNVATAVTSGANGIVTESASEAAKVINDIFEKNAFTRTPIMIGHRGNPTLAPENSIASFLKAYENGGDVFEIDIDVTKDGHVIVMHDNSIKRTTNYNGSLTVNQMTLEEIKQYRLLNVNGSVSEYTVPTLKELLEEFKDKDIRIFIEIKGSNAKTVPETIKLLKEYDMTDRVDFISFGTNFLSALNTQLPGTSTGFLSAADNAVTAEDALNAFYKLLVTAQGVNSSVNPANNCATTYFMQAAVDRGMTVWPWTYVATNNQSGFFSGCDGVTTNDMQWVKNMYKLLTAADISLEPGKDADISATAQTYGRTDTALAAKDLIVKVLSGSEYITVENGKVKGVKEGEAAVMYGYKTKSTDGREYILYTQPVSVTVRAGAADSSGETTPPVTGDGTVSLIVVAVITLIALAGAAVVVKKVRR